MGTTVPPRGRQMQYDKSARPVYYSTEYSLGLVGTTDRSIRKEVNKRMNASTPLRVRRSTYRKVYLIQRYLVLAQDEEFDFEPRFFWLVDYHGSLPRSTFIPMSVDERFLKNIKWIETNMSFFRRCLRSLYPIVTRTD
jgi:hypothetical protein